MAAGALTLEIMIDKDLLYILEECGDEEGYASSNDIAEKIGLKGKYKNQNVGVRLANLKKWGVLEAKIEDGITFWRLNKVGETLMSSASTDKEVKALLNDLDEAQKIAITEMLAKQIASDSRKIGRPTAHLARRAWRHSMGRWRDPSITPQRV